MNTYVEINESAIEHNTGLLRNILNPKTKIISVIKANGYGCGLVEVAHVCERLNIDMLAVLDVDQARQLRNAGITSPILILGQTLASEFQEILDLDVVQVALSEEFARRLSEFALQQQSKAKVHVKYDSGLHRLGLHDVDAIERVYALPGLDVQGIYSHFAEAQSSEVDAVAFSDLQLSRFENALDALKARGIEVGMTHLQNSPSILRQGDLGFDAVRCGMIMFGLFHPSQKDDAEARGFLPVHKMVTHVAMVRDLEPGEVIGYGRTYTVDVPLKEAVVSAGYCDGVMKPLSLNRGTVVIDGTLCPVIGDIAMSQFFVDVSDVSCAPEDEVILFGVPQQTIYDYLAITGQSINELISHILYGLPRKYTRTNV